MLAIDVVIIIFIVFNLIIHIVMVDWKFSSFILNKNNYFYIIPTYNLMFVLEYSGIADVQRPVSSLYFAI